LTKKTHRGILAAVGFYMESKVTVYQICSLTTVYETFSTLEKARNKLRQYAQERRNKMGVHDFQMSENGNSFSFLLGWEEIEVKFFIKAVEVNE
jgi:hypothetical protein